jgi:ribonuclease-3
LTDALDWSSRHLGYRFVDERLLEQALTHRSAGAMHNERLEFLGDAVLGMVIARALYERKPRAREGALSRYRARLVRKETLAALARELQLDQHLQMGPGEYRTGGHQRSTVLADALEALFGAVLLDSDIGVAAATIERLFADRLDALPAEADLIDAKTALQEWLQARGLPPPEYELVEVLGADHARTFTSQCRVPALGLETRGSGRSRRLAEQAAAGCAMQQVGDDS